MSATTYSAAMELLREARYLEFKGSYASEAECEVMATYNPMVIITVEDVPSRKKIIHYHGCQGFEGQEALTQLEDNVDKVLYR